MRPGFGEATLFVLVVACTAFVYAHTRWVKHDPDGAVILAIIIFVAGCVATLLAAAINWAERRRSKRGG